MAQAPHRDVITTREAAEMLGTSQGAVRMAILHRGLPTAFATRYGHHRLYRDEVLAWADAHPIQPHKPRQAWLATAQALEDLGSATADEVAAYRDIHPGNVRKHLLILGAQGAAERRPDGQWVLTATETVGAA